MHQIYARSLSKNKIDLFTQQVTSDLCNFSNTIDVQHYKRTTTQQLTTDLCYDKSSRLQNIYT